MSLNPILVETLIFYIIFFSLVKFFGFDLKNIVMHFYLMLHAIILQFMLNIS
jgi:hypothetical protein